MEQITHHYNRFDNKDFSSSHKCLLPVVGCVGPVPGASWPSRVESEEAMPPAAACDDTVAGEATSCASRPLPAGGGAAAGTAGGAAAGREAGAALEEAGAAGAAGVVAVT